MEKTWRWFGPNDAVKLGMLRQIGVEGIVTSLHDVPNGAVWTHEKLRDSGQRRFHGRMLALGQIEGMICAVRSYGRFCNQGKIN